MRDAEKHIFWSYCYSKRTNFLYLQKKENKKQTENAEKKETKEIAWMVIVAQFFFKYKCSSSNIILSVSCFDIANTDNMLPFVNIKCHGKSKDQNNLFEYSQLMNKIEQKQWWYLHTG